MTPESLCTAILSTIAAAPIPTVNEQLFIYLVIGVLITIALAWILAWGYFDAIARRKWTEWCTRAGLHPDWKQDLERKLNTRSK